MKSGAAHAVPLFIARSEPPLISPSRSAPAFRWHGHRVLRTRHCRRRSSSRTRNRKRATALPNRRRKFNRGPSPRLGLGRRVPRLCLRGHGIVDIQDRTVVVTAASGTDEKRLRRAVGQRPAELVVIGRRRRARDRQSLKGLRRSDPPAVGGRDRSPFCFRPTRRRHGSRPNRNPNPPFP